MSGPLGSASGAELARLAREYLLAGHLIDRAGMPQVLAEHGREAMQAVAIEEWMAASPIYTRRMQQLLAFQGDDVATIFKGMQLDIGAPPEFMDFRYRVDDARHGEFWLESCGALMDVERMGEELVVTMCHHIEDPTFDATAAATNPRARVRPVHRPPRRPADRHPHCHWTVEIDPTVEPLPEPEPARRLASSHAARLPLPLPTASGRAYPFQSADTRVQRQVGEDGGRDYAGAFDPDLRLESFARPTLLALLDEICLQGHLLSLGFASALERRFGQESAARLVLRQFTGIAGLTAHRLVRAFQPPEPETSGLVRVAQVLELHPAFRPRGYVALRADATADDELVVEIGPCPALDERPPGWISLLAAGHLEPLAAIVQAVEPRARVEPLDGTSMCSITFDPARAPAPLPDEVVLASFSTGGDFAFQGGGPREV